MTETQKNELTKEQIVAQQLDAFITATRDLMETNQQGQVPLRQMAAILLEKKIVKLDELVDFLDELITSYYRAEDNAATTQQYNDYFANK